MAIPSKRNNREAKTRRVEVAAAIAAIRGFHRLGKKVPEGLYGAHTIDVVATALKEGQDGLRKARVFADPEKGYTDNELETLCQMIQEVQGNQSPGKPCFGRSHIIKIVSVPKKKRRAVQMAAIKGAWSYAQLTNAIKQRFGTRKAGGRRRRVPNDPIGLLTQLESLGESWRRWWAVAQTDAADALAELPPALRREIGDAAEVVIALQRAVAAQLGDISPGQKPRPRFDNDE